MEDPAIMHPSPDNGNAWLLWIISTVVLPAIAGATFSTGGGSFALPIGLGVLAFCINLGGKLRHEGTFGWPGRLCLPWRLDVDGWFVLLWLFGSPVVHAVTDVVMPAELLKHTASRFPKCRFPKIQVPT